MTRDTDKLRSLVSEISEIARHALSGLARFSAPVDEQPACCVPKFLPSFLDEEAAREAVRINPHNYPTATHALSNVDLTPSRIAVMTSRRWHTNGVHLRVGFLDSPSPGLRRRVLEHMNAWSRSANVSFVESSDSPEVRIAREPGKGHWSYLGTDILRIDPDQPTMNLDSFTDRTDDREYRRVVRHETGHTLGFPHEHMRQELVDRIDVQKAIAFYGATQGWSPEQVKAQVLTPIHERSLLGTPHADPKSIMCYHIPGSLTKDGLPILGGTDIDETDYAYAASFYPKTSAAA